MRQDRTDALGGFVRAWHDELEPLRPGGDHLDGGRLGRLQRLAHGCEEHRGLDRFVHVLECLFPYGFEQRFRRVIRRHDHHAWTGFARAELREHIETVHARHPDVEQEQIELIRAHRLQRVDAVLGDTRREPCIVEHALQHVARGPVVVHDEDLAHERPRFRDVPVRFARVAGLDGRGPARGTNPAVAKASSSTFR
jgi:hypothetical protein